MKYNPIKEYAKQRWFEASRFGRALLIVLVAATFVIGWYHIIYYSMAIAGASSQPAGDFVYPITDHGKTLYASAIQAKLIRILTPTIFVLCFVSMMYVFCFFRLFKYIRYVSSGFKEETEQVD